MNDSLGYYQILNVADDADYETIKQAYHSLAKQWHPDYNSDEQAAEIFKKISVAYDVLKDDKKRLVYDILSKVYSADKYPEYETMQPFESNGNGVDVVVIKLKKISAWLVGYKEENTVEVADKKTAVKLSIKVLLNNLFLGWWHPKSFFKNISAIIRNLNSPVSNKETLRILLHNMITYNKDGKQIKSSQCASLSKKYTPSTNKIDDFIAQMGLPDIKSKMWSVSLLKVSQFSIFGILLLIAATVKLLQSDYINDKELWGFMNKKKEINYYQVVKMNNNRATGFDDVVVGNVINIPVDKTDTSKLYHLTDECKVMYGPSEEFDVIKMLKKNTTVRFTGYTPDNVWARVMIDNGELGFVLFSCVEQGIGKEIPFGSKIIN